jgi:hypothetical protein
VLLRSPGRPGYVIAELEPSDGVACALLDYAVLYARAPEGSVPYKTWPSLLKGHFLCRIPPESPPARAASPDDALPPEPALHDAEKPHTEPAERAPQDPAP